jgi:Glycosyl hydrolase catalytic core
MDRRPTSPFLVGLSALALTLGCANSGGTQDTGTGGTSAGGSGGAASGSGGSGSGGSGTGAVGSGGASGTGGASSGTGGGATGGAKGGTGGSTATGGSAGKAGATGGTPGTGGGAGSKGTGGAVGTGGTGGSTGSGGATAGQMPFKGFAGDPTACTDMQHLGVSWYYNWKQTPTNGCASTGVPFVPMIWGHASNPDEQSASAITSAVTSFVSKDDGYVLGFNEPDNSTQSNIPVATAVSLWPSFNNSAIQLGTPATQANSTGQTWFTSFMASLNGSSTLHADFIALHWYGWNTGSCDAAASQLESYIKYAEAFSGNRPIWLTEWGCLNDSAPDVPTVVSFYNGALAVFARHPRVQRYSWYPWSTNLYLVNSDGSLTTLGTAYAAAPAYK